MTLERHADRLRPVRGLVAAHNVRLRPFGEIDVARWLRLNRTVFKAAKVDLVGGDRFPRLLDMALARAQELGFRLSLRSDAGITPPDLKALSETGLFDVFLTPARMDAEHLTAWLDAARKAGLPVRLQIHPPSPDGIVPTDWCARLRDAGVVAVNLAPYDPFVITDTCRNREHSQRTLNAFVDLADALENIGIEATFVRFPKRFLPESQRHRALEGTQIFLDHQQYALSAYEIAERLWSKSPAIAGKIIGMLLGRHTLIDDPIDRKLLPWLLESPWLRARVVAWHRLTRHLRLTRAVPEPIIDSEAAYDAAVQALEARTPPEYIDPRFTHAFPGLTPLSDPETPVNFPLPPSPAHLKYYDPIDHARLEHGAHAQALAEEALRLTDGTPPDREIDSHEYAIEGQWCHQLPGGLRWHGFTNTEKRSTPLGTFDPPFTVSAVFGGGIAEYIGFGVGREARIMCPMEAYGHRLILHVAADGRYVLLRDGQIVRPISFDANRYIPERIGTQTKPFLCIQNIDNSLVTQNVSLWSEALRRPSRGGAPRFTVLTVCVRYARRLQAVMQSILHQLGVSPNDIEFIVAYVPGVDSTEDVLDTVAAAHPDVRIQRAPFSETKARAKGFQINEALEKASGEWVVLLDADTLAPPNLLQRVISEGRDADFLVPDGRKLLDRETTARVLLGELSPWRDWDALLASAGEFRFREMEGVPIGFCQIVRRSCFDKVRYYEVDHFEGADWQFSLDMRKEFGPEKRLSGLPVLHLDHGGSKWYGTAQHY